MIHRKKNIWSMVHSHKQTKKTSTPYRNTSVQCCLAMRKALVYQHDDGPSLEDGKSSRRNLTHLGKPSSFVELFSFGNVSLKNSHFSCNLYDSNDLNTYGKPPGFNGVNHLWKNTYNAQAICKCTHNSHLRCVAAEQRHLAPCQHLPCWNIQQACAPLREKKRWTCHFELQQTSHDQLIAKD